MALTPGMVSGCVVTSLIRITSSVDFQVPTDKALSILLTRLDEHAQPPWRISAEATLSARSPYAPLTLTLSQRAREPGKLLPP